MKIKFQNQYQEIVLNDFIKQKDYFIKQGNKWIAMNLESLESLIFFSDKYWTPKFKSISDEKGVRKFINNWFLINKKSFDRLCEKDKKEYENKDKMLEKIMSAQKDISEKIDKKLLNIKKDKKNLKIK